MNAMNPTCRILSFLVLALAFRPAQAQVTLSTFQDSLAYALGVDIASNLTASGVSLNPDLVYQGLAAGLKKEGKFDAATLDQLLVAFQEVVRKTQEQQARMKAELNLQEGKLFLESNGKRPGVITTASGLQYEVLREGTGISPTATSRVKVHYEGRLIDDQVFDSSYKRGQPIEFGLNQVIKGWTEGLQYMKTGAKHRIFIPSNLGYGLSGAGNLIGPNATLIFDVELLEVK